MAKKELTQEQLIANWKKAKAKATEAEDAMRQHFNRIFTPRIKAAKTNEDIESILFDMREMPNCVGKVLLDRACFIQAGVINGHICPKCLIDKPNCSCKKV